jgi:hypothetical protein
MDHKEVQESSKAEVHRKLGCEAWERFHLRPPGFKKWADVHQPELAPERARVACCVHQHATALERDPACRRPIKMSPLWQFKWHSPRILRGVFGVTVRLMSDRELGYGSVPRRDPHRTTP